MDILIPRAAYSTNFSLMFGQSPNTLTISLVSKNANNLALGIIRAQRFRAVGAPSYRFARDFDIKLRFVLSGIEWNLGFTLAHSV